MSEKWIICGGASPISIALADLVPDVTVLSRIAPASPRVSHLEIGDLAEASEIDRAVSTLRRCLAEASDADLTVFVPLQGVSVGDWATSVNVNLLSVARLSEVFASEVPAERTRSLVLVGSASAHLGGKLPYAATKAALVGVARSLARTYPACRTNLVVPGAIAGGMTSDWSPEKVDQVSGRTFAGRLALPDEIAELIVAVARSTYLSGSVIDATSGQV